MGSLGPTSSKVQAPESWYLLWPWPARSTVGLGAPVHLSAFAVQEHGEKGIKTAGRHGQLALPALYPASMRGGALCAIRMMGAGINVWASSSQCCLQNNSSALPRIDDLHAGRTARGSFRWHIPKRATVRTCRSRAVVKKCPIAWCFHLLISACGILVLRRRTFCDEKGSSLGFCSLGNGRSKFCRWWVSRKEVMIDRSDHLAWR